MEIEFRWLTILMRVQLRKVRQRQLEIKYSLTSRQLLEHINLYLDGFVRLNNPQFNALKCMFQHFCCFGSNLNRILHRLRSRLPLQHTAGNNLFHHFSLHLRYYRISTHLHFIIDIQVSICVIQKVLHQTQCCYGIFNLHIDFNFGQSDEFSQARIIKLESVRWKDLQPRLVLICDL